MGINAIAPWFGANRILAESVGHALEGCNWVGVLFAGGMSEVKYIAARTILVNDLHRWVINLARVVADKKLGPRLVRELRRIPPVHPDVLAGAQSICRAADWSKLKTDEDRFQQAFSYFICAWMGRNGHSGDEGEFKTKVSLRYNSNGGDSAVRVRSAIESLRSWRNVLARATFTTDDVFVTLDKCVDRDGHGIYSDAPWPDDGDSYLHKFPPAKQEELAERLAAFEKTRVVVRFGEHPLIRRLYPEDHWTWYPATSRTTHNKKKAEFLIINKSAEGAYDGRGTGGVGGGEESDDED